MPTFTSIKEYKNTLNNRIRKIKKIKSVKKAANIMTKDLVQMAPRKTGETIRGIRNRRKKNSVYIVESMVSQKGKTRFMQNFWANRTPPHHRPRMFWNKFRPTIYGDGSHRITGTPGFFTIATKKIRVRFPKLSIREVRGIINKK